MKVLVIDDDEGMRRMLARMLDSAGYEVVCAEDGLSGMALIGKEQPAIVITDIFMPGQEGIETILAIRRDAPETKIIAISGGGQIGNSDLLKMAQLLGADEAIRKPFRADELLASVATLAAGAPSDPA